MTAFRAWPAGRMNEGAITLVPVRREDLISIMRWRNAQIDVLRQAAPLTEVDQHRYWDEVIAPSFDHAQPRQILVSVLEGQACVAYGGLVHIDWPSQRAEVSFLSDTAISADEARHGELFAAYLQALKRIAFDQLGFHRLFTETYDIRPHHVRVLESCGFQPEGRMVDHVRIGDRFVDALLHGCIADA